MKYQFSDEVPPTRNGPGSIPAGFEPVYVLFPKGKKVRYRCRHEFCGIDGITRQCIVYFKTKLEIPRTHEHHYLLEPENDPSMLRRMYREREDIRSLEALNKKLDKTLAMLGGQLDISVAKLASNQMARFVRRLMSLGFNVARQNPELECLPSGVKISSRTVLTQRMRQLGNDKKEKNLFLMQETGFVNIACDSGTVVALHCLHAMATNPWVVGFPVVLISEKCGRGYSAEQYAHFLSETADGLFDHRIQLCGVVTDNLVAQTRGISLWISRSEDPRVRAVIPVRCVPHSLNLVGRNTEQANSYFAEKVNIVREVVKIIRSASGSFISKCPKLVETRWLYILDSLKFLLDHVSPINEYLVEADQNNLLIGEEMMQIYQILLPLRTFLMRAEASDTSLCSLIPLYRNFLDLMKSIWITLQQEDMQVFFHDILARTMARVMVSAHDACITAFLLTNEGREEQRKRNQGFSTKGGRILGPRWRTGSLENAEAEYRLTQYRLLPLSDDSCSEEEEVQEEWLENDDVYTLEANVDQESEPLSTNWFSQASYLEAEKAFMEQDVEQLWEIEIFPEIYAVGLRTLQTYAKLLQPDLSDRKVRELLNGYLFDDLGEILNDFIRRDPNAFWREMRKYDKWEALSALALHFITLPVSEADVERLFSRQKQVMGPYSTNMSTETLEARLRLHMQ